MNAAKKRANLEEVKRMETVGNDVVTMALSEFVIDLMLSEIDNNSLPIFLESISMNEQWNRETVSST